MDEEELSEIEDLLLLWALYRKYKRLRRQPRRFWVRSIFSRRRKCGSFGTLVQEMRLSDVQSHFRYFRMSKERFNYLLHKVGPALTKRYCSSTVRQEISPAERLSVVLATLRELTGQKMAVVILFKLVGGIAIHQVICSKCAGLEETGIPVLLPLLETHSHTTFHQQLEKFIGKMNKSPIHDYSY